MATPTIKTKIAMDGEKEYKAALSDINSGLKVLNSEMKLTSEQFADNAGSVEALTQKQDVLGRQILSQKEKIDTLKAALQNSAETYGEADKKTDAWKISLNNAEAQLIKMERELDDTTDALQEAKRATGGTTDAMDDLGDALGETGDGAKESKGKLQQFVDALGETGEESKGLGDAIGELGDKLGVSLPDNAKDALNSLTQINGATALLAGGAAAAAAAIVKIEKALINLTKERAQIANTLANISATIGINVEATQQWDYVLKTVGSSIEEAQGDLSAFQEKILEASEGAGEAAEMFGKLGVAVVDQNGELRGTEEVLLDTVHALQDMTNETERNAISSILLGGTGEKLIPIYRMTNEELDFLLERKKELGILTGEEIEQLQDVSRAVLDYEERTAAASDKISADFAPNVERFYEMAGEGVSKLGNAVTNSGLVNAFGALLDIFSALSPALDILGATMELAQPWFDGFAVSAGVLADTLNVVLSLLSALVNVLTLDFGGAADDWDRVMGVFSGNSATGDALAGIKNRNSSGNYNFGGGYTWVGENGPEKVYLPQGSQIQTAQESRSGGDTFYVTIDAHNVKDFEDVVNMAKNKRRLSRMEVMG